MSFKQKLVGRVDGWKNKNIISDEQRLLIIQDIDRETHTGRFFQIIASIGAVFIGLGVILIISSNWAALPKVIKLILVLLMPIIPIVVGYYMSFIKHEYKKIGEACIFLGTILIGASLALLSQLYNIDMSISVLLIGWCILTIPFTFLLQMRTLAALTISLFYTALFFYIGDNHSFWRDELTIIWSFVGTSAIISIVSYLVRTKVNKKFERVGKVFELLSVKILLALLLISTLDNDLYLFGSSAISGLMTHLIFIVTAFSIIWLANKNYNNILLNSGLFWVGIFVLSKYIDWMGSYMATGFGFIAFGIFLMLMVYVYIRTIKFFKVSHNNIDNGNK